jgi:Na+-transporting NADH:ubiquinone oxidoreductase subunit NqrC
MKPAMVQRKKSYFTQSVSGILILFATLILGSAVFSNSETQGLSPQQKYQKLMMRFKQIQRQTLQNNPELRKEKVKLDSRIEKKMKGYLEEFNVDVQRVREIKKKLSLSKNMSRQEKQKLIGEFQSIKKQYQKARKKMMNNTNLIKKQQRIYQKVVAAMQKTNPEVRDILRQMRQMMQRQRKPQK